MFISSVVEVLLLKHKNMNPKYDIGVVLGSTVGTFPRVSPSVNERLHSSSLNYASPTGHTCVRQLLLFSRWLRQTNWFAWKPVPLKTHLLECLTCATQSSFMVGSIQAYYKLITKSLNEEMSLWFGSKVEKIMTQSGKIEHNTVHCG